MFAGCKTVVYNGVTVEFAKRAHSTFAGEVGTFILARLFLLQLNPTLGLLLRQLPASQESNLAHAIFIRVDRRFQVQFVLRRERLKQGA